MPLGLLPSLCGSAREVHFRLPRLRSEGRAWSVAKRTQCLEHRGGLRTRTTPSALNDDASFVVVRASVKQIVSVCLTH